jgi:thiamine kinase-like enzyme
MSDDIEHEYNSLVFLKKNGIVNVPQVIAYERAGNLYVLTLNFIEHRSKISIKGLKTLAGLLAQIHSIKSPDAAPTCWEQVHNILSEVSCLVGYLNQPKHLSLHKKCIKITQLLNRAIEDNKIYFQKTERLVFTNGDLADDSIYCDGNKISIIDWHASGFADNAWDMVRLFSNNPDIGNKKLFLKEYLSHIEDPYFIKRFETYWPINKLFTLLFFFFQSEWHSFPMQYASKKILEEKLDVLLKQNASVE